MDDDEMIRTLSALLIQRLGYNVTTCAKGEDAIGLYNKAIESDTPYLAVIIDLMMFGDMGGQEAAKEILHADPSAKLIVSSGNLFNPVMSDYKSYGFRASLPKPYTPSDMAEVLTSVLSS